METDSFSLASYNFIPFQWSTAAIKIHHKIIGRQQTWSNQSMKLILWLPLWDKLGELILDISLSTPAVSAVW